MLVYYQTQRQFTSYCQICFVHGVAPPYFGPMEMYQVGSIKDTCVLASEHGPNTPIVILPSTYRDLETPRINQVLLILIYPLLLLHLEMRVSVRLPTYLSLEPHHIVPIDWNIHIDRATECCFYLFLLVLLLHAGREPLWLG